ncbi:MULTISPECIES: hypothetical protein [unclassified Paracoccus (in: a-proteobacteria)]|uniref:hypothetical protein n=1 Tax=unclassified Paracoccus (in: a-proteobacteria) TaxID=2688777 RepID=UPI0016000B9F|nr:MULTISPECIES: hypothetical protein [unclassified Paracoccus (in: a-proteobacteria)]MBB1490990.1 hypothetical protein [Paracoccus sp. MC1854]QQO45165.1 hypothetical protein JGR78_01835 [Paracoccus sp. MC1862]
MTRTRIYRRSGAPRGIVRAHMATFPARAGIFRRVVDAILPQVDRMVIVFNEMDEVPADIAANDRIEAITTDRDTKDLGRFFMPPEPDDIVFLVDDDILYPSDYVPQSIERATLIGWEGNVFGYGGMNHRGGDQQGTGWQATGMSQALPSARGVRMLGTGSVVARGDAVPSFSEMAPYFGHADVGFALLNLRAGRKAWMLPRAERWLRDGMTPELEASSVSGTLRTRPTLPVIAGIGEIIAAPLDHIGMAPRTRTKTAQEAT